MSKYLYFNISDWNKSVIIPALYYCKNTTLTDMSESVNFDFNYRINKIENNISQGKTLLSIKNLKILCNGINLFKKLIESKTVSFSEICSRFDCISEKSQSDYILQIDKTISDLISYIEN